jgi:hypothetical protein
MGPGSDPRLLGAAWANEVRSAAGRDETAEANRHRDADREAAKGRAGTRQPRSGILDRIAVKFQRRR